MAAPVNSDVPAITGTVEVGETLTASTGTWTGSPTSYTYQWQRIGDSTDDIDGATASSYVITSDDCGSTLRVSVTATNGDGSATAYSVETVEVPDDWFIVEDGTGKADAISLCSVADADSYHSQRGNSDWTQLTCGAKKALLIKATDYIGEAYRLRWQGSRVSETQALDWPRAYVSRADAYSTTEFYYPSDEVPKEVKNACALLALKANSAELAADLTQTVIREKVDVLEVEYDQNSPQYVRYRAVDNLLRPFLTGGPNSMKVQRV
jgi:hypothetical protein